MNTAQKKSKFLIIQPIIIKKMIKILNEFYVKYPFVIWIFKGKYEIQNKIEGNLGNIKESIITFNFKNKEDIYFF